MILHTLNKPPRAPAAIACLEVLTVSSEDGDSLLLLEDGVYMADNSNEELVRQVPTRIYALDLDIEARGLAHRVLPSIKVISYADFVQLVVEHKITKAWI